MYIDFSEISDYPFDGTFYHDTVDTNKPLEEQEVVEEVILNTKCDILENNHSEYSDFITATYAVYFPFAKGIENLTVQIGDRFRGSMYGMLVNGEVVGVFPSQLGGCLAYIKDVDING